MNSQIPASSSSNSDEPYFPDVSDAIHALFQEDVFVESEPQGACGSPCVDADESANLSNRKALRDGSVIFQSRPPLVKHTFVINYPPRGKFVFKNCALDPIISREIFGDSLHNHVEIEWKTISQKASEMRDKFHRTTERLDEDLEMHSLRKREMEQMTLFYRRVAREAEVKAKKLTKFSRFVTKKISNHVMMEIHLWENRQEEANAMGCQPSESSVVGLDETNPPSSSN